MPPGAAALISLAEGFHSFEQRGYILGRAYVFESHSLEFILGIAVLAHCRGIYCKKAQGLAVKDPGRMRIVVKQFAVPLFALLQPLFRSPVFSNVASDLRKSA